MRYFTTLTNHHCQAKNKLQAEWKAYMGQHANRILNDDDAYEALVGEITDAFQRLNHKHQKCKPLDFYCHKNTEYSFVIGASNDAQIVVRQENTKPLLPNG